MNYFPVFFDLTRQKDFVAELADCPGPVAQHSLALFLLSLPRHDQPPADHLDVDIGLVDARQVQFDDVGVVGLLNVGEEEGSVLNEDRDGPRGAYEECLNMEYSR